MKRLALTFLFLLTLSVAMSVSYVVGRGNLVVPSWIPAPLSAAVMKLLPDSPPSATTQSEIKDYEFQLIEQEAKQGEAIVAVRLVHKPTGKAIPDAVVFARRIDMAPEGMPTMTAPLELMPETEPGTYRFKTNLMMEGRWQLSLAAKVQGEAGTVQGKLILKAV